MIDSLFRPSPQLHDHTPVLALALTASALSLLGGIAVVSQDEWFSAAVLAVLSSMALFVWVVALDSFSLGDDMQARRWILIGYALRVLFAFSTRFFYVLDDEPSYTWLVSRFIKGQPPSVATLQRGHGYAHILALFYTFWGEHIVIGRLLNCLVGALGLILVYKIALAIFGRRQVARLALILTAVYPILVKYSAVQMRDIWLVLFTVGLVWAVVSHGPWMPRLLVFTLSGAAFALSRLPQALAFMGLCAAYLLLAALMKKRWRLALLYVAALLLLGQFFLVPQYQASWQARWEGKYLSLSGRGAEEVEAFSGTSRQLIYGQRSPLVRSLLTFGRLLFSPMPTHILSGFSFPNGLASISGLIWYVGLPFAGLAVWAYRRQPASWLLLGMVLINKAMLSPTRLAFSSEPSRGSVACLPAFFILTAAGYVAYRDLEPGQRQAAFGWLLLCGLFELGLIGLYTYLAF